jgi:tetratricopeptide (TPR) repeat protein
MIDPESIDPEDGESEDPTADPAHDEVENVFIGSADNVFQINKVRDITINEVDDPARSYAVEPFPNVAEHHHHWLRDQPSRLLDARRAVVPFTGRKAELELLAQWRDAPHGRAFLLCYGPGGQGKSRLAARFAEQSRAGWTILQAHAGATRRPSPARSSAAPTLLIIDYADRWPPDALHALYGDLVRRRTGQLRVLLLARTVDWWAAERGELDDLDAITDQLRLGEISGEDRTESFTAALSAFAKCYEIDAPQQAPPAAQSVLSLHTHALVAVDAASQGVPIPVGEHRLSAYLLDREWMSWKRHYRGGRAGSEFGTPPSVMARLVFVAALVGAVSDATGRQLVKQLDLEGHADRTLADHSTSYPPIDPSTRLEPLYPDRLAEDLLALRLPGHDVDAYGADPWTTTALAIVLDPNNDSSYLSRALTMLLAAAERWPHVTEQHLFPLLLKAPRVAIAAGGRVLTMLAERADIEVLKAIEPLLPPRGHRHLAAGTAAVVQRLTAHRTAATTDIAVHAKGAAHDGYRLLHAHRPAEAAERLRTAVNIYRRLAGDTPVHVPDLANALQNLGIAHWHQRENRVALAFIKEAEALYRGLLRDDPDRWVATLGTVIRIRSDLLDHLSDREGALAAATEAVGLLRESDASVLAAALKSLAVRLSRLGRATEARSATEQAAALLRAEALDEPDELTADLANTLTIEALHADRMGRQDDAIARATEAVRLHRIEAAINPEQPSADLAAALVNLGKVLIGQPKQAAEATSEAVAIYRRLTGHDHELATALSNLAASCGLLGDQRREMEALEEALPIFRVLGNAMEISCVLSNLVTAHGQMGQTAEGLRYAEEAVKAVEPRRRKDPIPYRPELARALTNLATMQQRSGKRRASVKTARRGVEVYEQLLAEEPELFRDDHWTALLNLAEFESSWAEYARARTATARAVQIAERGMSRENLGYALMIRAEVFADGRVQPEEGLYSAVRAADIYTALDEESPGRYAEELARIATARRTLERRLGRQ